VDASATNPVTTGYHRTATNNEEIIGRISFATLPSLPWCPMHKATKIGAEEGVGEVMPVRRPVPGNPVLERGFVSCRGSETLRRPLTTDAMEMILHISLHKARQGRLISSTGSG